MVIPAKVTTIDKIEEFQEEVKFFLSALEEIPKNDVSALNDRNIIKRHIKRINQKIARLERTLQETI